MALSPNLVDDEKFFPLLQRLKECLCSELAAAGGPDLCYCGLTLGSTPPPFGVMDCAAKACGVAWVRPVEMFSSTTFPNPEVASRCGTTFALQVEVGVARCYPRPVGKAMYPDEQAVFESVRLGMSDAKAARRAILCCLPKGQAGIQVRLGSWLPLDASAGAAGGVWQAWIG